MTPCDAMPGLNLQRQITDCLHPNPRRVSGEVGQRHVLDINNLDGGRVYRGTPAIENNLFGRQQVGVRRLPKIIEQLRELRKRVEELESAANDPERG